MLSLTGLLAGSTAAGPTAAANAGLPAAAPLGSPTPAAPVTRRPAATRPSPRVRRPPAAAKRTPAAVKIAASGPGTFHTAQLAAPTSGKRGKLLRYRVRVEKGLPFDPETTAAQVHRTLSDRRSWTGSGRWRFQLVGPGQRFDFTVSVATPRTTDRLCAPLLTRGTVSCQRDNQAILNAQRWAFGVRYYGRQVNSYRVYLVNHEVGHVLGYGHQRCPGRGQVAPVMQQQTKGLQGCRANPWPSPRRR